ncbi:sugar phosphate isomerase/epimerase family protein [Streptomyces cyaneus]|uniref:sugar phosphate isomerase/epimerase family protein n=1 Tax=Streptomyces cyaneus TaxID=1904 RepID=UPI000FF88D97|nr:sugar phosphate isomerase/epimerase family protein [Streptomyces cyaneus]
MTMGENGTGRLLGIGDEGAKALEDQIRLHRELGWRALELRTIDGTALHDIPDDRHEEHARRLRESGITVAVLDTPIGSWAYDVGRPLDEDARMLDRYAAIGRTYGTTRMRVMSYPNDGRPEGDWRRAALRRMSHLAARASDLGITLLHENCHGWASTDPHKSLEMLAEVGSPHLTLLFDTGNGVSYGYDSLEFLAPIVQHVQHVHVKDSTTVDGEVVFVEPGTGDSRVLECVELLEESGYRGLYSIEPHLHLVPHQKKRGDASRMPAEYLAYGQLTENLLAKVVRPAAASNTVEGEVGHGPS